MAIILINVNFPYKKVYKCMGAQIELEGSFIFELNVKFVKLI